MKIKERKINEMKREFNGGFLEDILGVERETEKAALLLVRWSYTSSLSRTEKVWVPKSCILSDEDVASEAEARRERSDAACNRYDALVAWAKEHGVKGVRPGLKTATIMEKIQAAGLVYNA